MSRPQDDQHTAAESMRWYTRALKIPRLIGKLPSGERIKGGPYRQSQLVTAGGLVLIGQPTMRWWGHWGFFGNWGILLGVAAAAGVAAKYIPTGTVNPLQIAVGALRLAGRPRTGLWCGRPASVGAAPTRVIARVTTSTAPPPTVGRAAPAPPTIPPPAPSLPVPAPAVQSEVAGVESKLAALLAAARS